MFESASRMNGGVMFVLSAGSRPLSQREPTQSFHDERENPPPCTHPILFPRPVPRRRAQFYLITLSRADRETYAGFTGSAVLLIPPGLLFLIRKTRSKARLCRGTRHPRTRPRTSSISLFLPPPPRRGRRRRRRLRISFFFCTLFFLPCSSPSVSLSLAFSPTFFLFLPGGFCFSVARPDDPMRDQRIRYWQLLRTPIVHPAGSVDFRKTIAGE